MEEGDLDELMYCVLFKSFVGEQKNNMLQMTMHRD